MNWVKRHFLEKAIEKNNMLEDTMYANYNKTPIIMCRSVVLGVFNITGKGVFEMAVDEGE